MADKRTKTVTLKSFLLGTGPEEFASESEWYNGTILKIFRDSSLRIPHWRIAKILRGSGHKRRNKRDYVLYEGTGETL